MTRTFIQTDEFSRNWDEFGFTDDDLRRLEFDIMMNPHKYPVVQGKVDVGECAMSILS